MKNQNGTAQGKEANLSTKNPENEVKEVKFQPLPPEVQELITRLKQENASLKIKAQEQPLSLEDKIKFFQLKKAKIDQLAKLDAYAEGLVKVGQEAQEESEGDEFFSERYSVRVSRKANKYNQEWTDLLTIQNPVLVVEILGYALERINAKRKQLQTEIEA